MILNLEVHMFLSSVQLWLGSQAPLSSTLPEDKQLDFFSLHSQV